MLSDNAEQPRTALRALKRFFERRLPTAREYEAYLLAIETSFYEPGKGHSKALRYRKDRSGNVYSLGSSWAVGASLWREYVNGLRHPRAFHEFAWAGPVDGATAIDGFLPTTRARCSKCGDTRQVYMGLSIDEVNRTSNWCINPRYGGKLALEPLLPPPITSAVKE